jgi:D-beta-D-heptose 7-phosphate kinase/D-beta-D-heptose 1-phosphate adenosyltransferase
VLVLSDYGKGALKNHQVIQAARAKGIPVLADPKGKDFSIYRGASLITPNLSEFETIVGRCADEAELVAKGLQLLHDLDLGALLVTRGEHGMTLLRTGHPALHLPARAREVFDVTGAGDTVISTLAAAIAAGEELPHAVALANLAAGIVVGKLGTAAISAPNCAGPSSVKKVPSAACWALSNCCWPLTTRVRTTRRSSSPMAASTSCMPAM